MLKYIPLLAALLMSACNHSQFDSPDSPQSITLVLNITDMEAESRASLPTSGSEPINTLRVILARPDGTVEANRLLRPLGNTLGDDDLRFNIHQDDFKVVVLIANEAATGLAFDDFSYLSPAVLDNPDSFADHHINTVIDRLPTAATSVPMTAIYRLGTTLALADKIGDGKYEVRYNLCLMRAVTKFTFNITNERNIPVTIGEIGINNTQASRYYLFPRVNNLSGSGCIHYLTANGADVLESGTGSAPVSDSGAAGISPFSEYYRDNFMSAATGENPHIFTDGTMTLAPSTEPLVLEYYHYESNLPAGADTKTPYSMYVDFDGNRYWAPLKNLPTLPRNTHVVVNLTFTNNDKLLEIETLPYFGVNLYPGFGNKN